MTSDRPQGSETAGRFPPLARFRFELGPLEPIELPEYPGSAWRGLLGHGLRRTACVTRQPNCTGCLLIQSCVYSLLFETPPPPGIPVAGFTAMPHPYVLDIDPDAPRQYDPDEPVGLGLTLIGSAVGQVPYLIHALVDAGRQGIGRERGRFRLDAVRQERTLGAGPWEPVYDSKGGEYRPVPPVQPSPPPAPKAARLHIRTPLRMKHDGRFVGPRDFQLPDLLRHLYNRLQRLSLLYGGQPETHDWPHAWSLAGQLCLESASLRWHDWTRYSSRQDTPMQLGGLMGELTIAGPALPQVWPALWVGQWTHVGKGTAFGLGSYRLEAAG